MFAGQAASDYLVVLGARSELLELSSRTQGTDDELQPGLALHSKRRGLTVLWR
jgi:hypothetical protein